MQFNCSGLDYEFVELWGECYNIEETTFLDLSNSGLTGQIPPTIGDLVNLIGIICTYHQMNYLERYLQILET